MSFKQPKRSKLLLMILHHVPFPLEFFDDAVAAALRLERREYAIFYH